MPFESHTARTPSYTHGHAEPVLRSHAWRTAANSAAYLLPHLESSHHLLDIGAGPGTISVDLAQHVAQMTVTEISDEALALSRRAAEDAECTTMAFAVEDVLALSFEDDTFDVVHAHQVLQHVSDPVQALREMARVTKPGGLVAARDADYGMFTWWPAEPGIERWRDLYSIAARHNGGEPDAGRRLRSWALDAGLADVESSSSTWTYSTPDERIWWADLWAERTTSTALGAQLLRDRLSSNRELADIADAWRTWAAEDDGWFCVPSGEILWRKPA